ncbi:MAG: hypothetical protein QXS54_09385, partial [Candidatus Methanomethylicaceae archaeon]
LLKRVPKAFGDTPNSIRDSKGLWRRTAEVGFLPRQHICSSGFQRPLETLLTQARAPKAFGDTQPK